MFSMPQTGGVVVAVVAIVVVVVVVVVVEVVDVDSNAPSIPPLTFRVPHFLSKFLAIMTVDRSAVSPW